MAKKQNYEGMIYVEPANYFSEESRRKFKLGEFDDEVDEDEEETEE